MIQYEEVFDATENSNSIEPANEEVYLLTEDLIVEHVPDENAEEEYNDIEELIMPLICRLCCNEIDSDDIIPIFEEDSTNFSEQAINIDRLMPDKLVSWSI